MRCLSNGDLSHHRSVATNDPLNSLVCCAAVCGSVAQALALGQASLSPVLEGEGSIPVRDVGFSPQ